MTQYTLNTSNFKSAMVGGLYHIGLSDGAHQYGYVFQNWGGGDPRSAMNESSNIADKQALIQYSSPNLIDRDLVFYPRVSQGDFSGGALQLVFIDPTKVTDTDLNINVPGYTELRPSWLRQTQTLASPGSQSQVIGYNKDLYFTFSEPSGNVYRANVKTGGPITSGSPTAAAIVGLATNGAHIIAGTASAVYFDNSLGSLSAWVAIATALNGTALKWWAVDQGTFGRFVYYTIMSGQTTQLYKIDLNAGFPVAAGNQPQVPTANLTINIVDLDAYQNGLAILSTDITANNGFDVWFHDGQNLNRIIRVDGYRAIGLCTCMGSLYVGAEDLLTFGGPILFKVDTGNFEVVARPGPPGAYTQLQPCGQPEADGEFVFWPVQLTSSPLGLTNAGVATPRILAYNVLTAAVGYLPNLDNTDLNPATFATGNETQRQRNLTQIGSAVGFVFQSGNTGTIQYQQLANQSGSPTFQTSGWVLSSKYDFGTPGIPKRYRRIEVHHTPLNAGESVKVNAYVDLDPLNWTPSLAPVPAGATITNSTVGSGVTVLTIGNTTQASNVGRSLVYAVQLFAGSNQATTPKIIYSATEVGGTWIWDFDLDCTSRRRLLNQAVDDPQGVTGKDLYYLLRNAYENGTTLTLFLAEGVSYTVNIESLKASSFGYFDHQGTPVKADEEWLVHATLRQEAS